MVDPESKLGNTQTAEVLRKTMNEQSVEATHTLLKKSDEKQTVIAKLIISGEAKTTKQAEKSFGKNNSVLNTPHANSTNNKSMFKVGDIVFVDLKSGKDASSQKKRWNNFWGLITQIEEEGSLVVDVGAEELYLLPSDIRPLSGSTSELIQMVERVLRLCTLKLDKIEVEILDYIQQKEQFSLRQLTHLKNLEQFYR